MLAAQSAFGQHDRDVNINNDWKHIRQDVHGADTPTFNDSNWHNVSLPHTWNALDGQDGGNDYYRGVGWYRKRLMLDKADRGKSLFLKFDAASIIAHVFVNGKPAGKHKGAFSAFCLDVTDLLLFDTANIISVKVSNAIDSTVAPLRGDFTMFGGLYRGVHLLVRDRLSISPLDYASSGVYVKQTIVSREKAEIELTSVLRNASSRSRKPVVSATVIDAAGRAVASIQSPIQIEASTQKNILQHLAIKSPHLWDSRKDPYLYRVVVELREGNIVFDRVSEPLGLRYFSVDAGKGFSLNGEYYRLHGVNRHQDRENKGWAIDVNDHREDYRLIEEMGCTTIRLAHYQQAKDFYRLCDSGGMVVWAELALVDFVHPGKEFLDGCRQQLKELIKQNYNHPSIVFWSLFNELIPDADRQLYTTIVTNLNDLAHELDPTRFTALASRSMYDGSEFINTVTDVVGYNVYKGWYEEMPEDFAAYADSLHARFPRHKLSIAEYGAGAGTSQHEVVPKKPQTTARWHPEEWQSRYHEAHWKAMATRPYLWGTFIWNMFDFASDSRNEGELPGRNDKGLVTYDRKTKKDAFFWYKANWNPESMVYITSRRYSPRPTGETEVRVYSNCDSVSLTVNGEMVGTLKSSDNIYFWKPVTLHLGTNSIEAVAHKKDKIFTDTVIWEAR